MIDDYLMTVLEEADHVAERHDPVARTADKQAHEYLRYAVLQVVEGEADHLPADWTIIDGVTVGYGSDEAMYDSWDSTEDWWETVPPQEACTRFRVFFPDDYQTVSRAIVDVMGALGAWRVWTGSAAACGSYDHRERREGVRPSVRGTPPRAAQWPCGRRRPGRWPNGRRSQPVGRRREQTVAGRSRAPHEACRRRSDGCLTLLSIPLILAVIYYLTPISFQHHLVLDHTNPALHAFWTNSLVHEHKPGDGHLIGNIVGYTILVLPCWALYILHVFPAR